MLSTRIVLNVHCLTLQSTNPSYRVYLDDELMIARPFLWDRNKNYIEETIVANLPAGSHRVRIESSHVDDSFSISNVFVNSKEESKSFST